MAKKMRHELTEFHPPAIALRILEMVLPNHVVDHVVGDVCEEFFELVNSNSNPYSAKFWFWRQTLFALLFVSFKGNLKILAAIVNIFLFSFVSYLFLILSRYDFMVQQAWFLIGAALFLPIIILPVLNNARILQDVFIYLSAHTHTINETRLVKLSRFARLAKKNCLWVAALFIAISWVSLVTVPAMSNISYDFIAVFGFELIIFIHAFALHSVFSLLEQSNKSFHLANT